MESRTLPHGLLLPFAESSSEVLLHELAVTDMPDHTLSEHLGLIPPQMCQGPRETVTSFMRAAPFPNIEEFGTPEDSAVADPIADSTLDLWNNTARKNREIFTEVFRPVPTNFIRDVNGFDVCVYFPFVSDIADGILCSPTELRAQGKARACCTGHPS
jgi:hypothetical protein